MATNWRERIANAVNPRTAFENFTARPGQSLVAMGAGVLGSLLGGPVAGQAASRGVSAMFNRHNDARFDSAAQRLRDSGIANNNAAIWNTGNAGSPSSYTPTVPNSPSYGVGSPLLTSLGIPDYARPQESQGGLPGIASPLLSGMGPQSSTPYVGWAHTGVTPQIGVGGSPNRFNTVGHADRFSLAPT